VICAPEAPVRFYDPTTGQFLSRDPANAMTRSAYGYTGGNPLNMTDPSGLFGIPGTDLCVAIADDNCDNSGTQNFAGQFYAGAANALTLGHGEQAINATGQALGQGNKWQYVNTNSGAYFAGNVFGAATTVGVTSLGGYQMVANVGLTFSAGNSVSACYQGFTSGCWNTLAVEGPQMLAAGYASFFDIWPWTQYAATYFSILWGFHPEWKLPDAQAEEACPTGP
jgi:hypothetical protein